MFTVGKTRYTKVVHNKYTLCAWQNKLATKHCTEIQQVMYKGRNYYSKLVLKQCYFLLTHHTCLLSRNSTIAHPKPPTSIKRIKRGKWTFQLELCSSGEKKKSPWPATQEHPPFAWLLSIFAGNPLKAAPFLFDD